MLSLGTDFLGEIALLTDFFDLNCLWWLERLLAIYFDVVDCFRLDDMVDSLSFVSVLYFGYNLVCYRVAAPWLSIIEENPPLSMPTE